MVRKKASRFVRLLPIGAVALLASCSNAPILNPKGQVGADEKSLIITAALLMLIVVIPVIVLTLTFAFKYRASNTKAKFMPDWAHSRKIETVVWAVPIIIVIALGIVTWTSTHKLDPFRPLDSSAKPLTIEAISLDWKWLFIYPEQGIATVNQIAFPVNVPIDFKITSDTVMNSFFIPRLGSQIYSMAGMQTQLHLIANSAGTYNGISANFSGAGFSGMNFKAIAGTEQQFNDWVNKAKQSGSALDQAAYNQLAKQSEDNPVQYFSSVKANLFRDIIAKYMFQPMDKKMTNAMKSGS
ncbi:MAG TPA: ubiquinol oxidase subunit II [Spirochaetia bacterium]|nr:ubiquinol oxidase subunit II [Spirochaetia bacterium]